MVIEFENNQMIPINTIIEQVVRLCKKYDVKHLSLFGSFARGTALPTSDIDFIVYGCSDFGALEEEVNEIPTLRKIDLFDYDEVCNKYLREDMDRYGVSIY